MKFMKTRRFMAAIGAGAALTVSVVGCMSPSEYINNEVDKVKEGVNQQVEDFKDQVESAIPTVPQLPGEVIDVSKLPPPGEPIIVLDPNDFPPGASLPNP